MTAAQIAEAQRIYAIAVHRGLPPQRAQELAVVALHESGLDPHAKGPAVHHSGYGGRRAVGDFQLLSGGYQQRAKQLGGIETTHGNLGAILPDYEKFWKQHPNAPVGQAGSSVERSGKDAAWYARSFDAFNFLRKGGGPGPAAPAPAVGPAGPDNRQQRAQFAMTLINNLGHHGPPDMQALGEASRALHESEQPQPQPVMQPQDLSHPAAIVRGAFAFPVAGPAKFSNDWGGYRGDIAGHAHQGNDIFAAMGTPVVAIQDGVVSKMGPSKIGGNRVWINGKFYYAHLSGFAKGLKPGAQVRRGQVIGYVGNTGDAAGTPPHLHFGWSPNGSQGGSYANPYNLLKRLHG